MFRREELRRLAATYIDGTGITAHALSVQIIGRSNNVIIGRLLNGHEVSGRNLEVLSDFFAQEWPQGVAWPEGIARNGVIKEAAE